MQMYRWDSRTQASLIKDLYKAVDLYIKIDEVERAYELLVKKQ